MEHRRASDRAVLATKVGALPAPWMPPGRSTPKGCRTRWFEPRQRPACADWASSNSTCTTPTSRIVERHCSNHAAWRVDKAREIARAAGLPGFTCVQQPHTYLRPRPGAEFGANPHISNELLEYARAEHDLTVLGYSVLLSGTYTRSERPPARAVRPRGRQTSTGGAGRDGQRAGRDTEPTPDQLAYRVLVMQVPSTQNSSPLKHRQQRQLCFQTSSNGVTTF